MQYFEGLWAGKIINPYFCKDSGNRYRALITDDLLPETQARDFCDIWFQQNSTTCHTALKTMRIFRFR